MRGAGTPWLIYLPISAVIPLSLFHETNRCTATSQPGALMERDAKVCTARDDGINEG